MTGNSCVSAKNPLTWRILPVLLVSGCMWLSACSGGMNQAQITPPTATPAPAPAPTPAPVPPPEPPTPAKAVVIVFTGDSITQLWGNESAFKAKENWINKGVWGENSTQIATRFQKDVIDRHPDVVQIIAGTNDVNAGWQLCKSDARGLATATTPPEGEALKTQPETCSNLLYMVETAKQNKIQVFLGSIPPWGCADKDCGEKKIDTSEQRYERISQLNAWIKDFAEKEGATFVDYHATLSDDKGLHYRSGFSDDGIHPNRDGYAAMQAVAITVLP